MIATKSTACTQGRIAARACSLIGGASRGWGCADLRVTRRSGGPTRISIIPRFAMLGLTLAVPRMSLLVTEPPFAYADAS